MIEKDSKNDNIFFNIKDLKHCGINVIIGKTVRIRKPEKVSIGDNVIIDDFTYIPCELNVGDFTHIGASTTFIGGKGHVNIGSFVNIAPGCQIVTGTNDYKGGGLVGPTIPDKYQGKPIIKPINISDHSLIGCQCVILPGTNLPEGISIGAMSLVKNLPYDRWSLYAGNPIRKLGSRSGDIIIENAKKIIYERDLIEND